MHKAEMLKELPWCPEHIQTKSGKWQLDSGAGEWCQGQHAALFKGLWEQRERQQKERGGGREVSWVGDRQPHKEVPSGSLYCWCEVKARANVTKTAREKARIDQRTPRERRDQGQTGVPRVKGGDEIMEEKIKVVSESIHFWPDL